MKDASRRNWIQLAIGGVAAIVGAALTLKPFSSLEALSLFVAAALIAAGVAELLPARRAQGRWRYAAAAALIAAGIVAALAPDLTTRALATVAGVALVIAGGARLLGVGDAQDRSRYESVVGGLAQLVLGILALLWPDVSVLAIALLVGPAAVIVGIGQIREGWRGTAGGDRRQGPVRRFARIAGVTLALLIAVALAGASAVIHDRAPQADDFYEAPGDLPAEPGVLLRSEPFDRGMPSDSSAWRILYTTTGAKGEIRVASALVLVPEDGQRTPRDVLLWTHGTTGVAEACAPTLLPDPLGAGAMPGVEQALGRGWAIVAPDYLGLGTEGPHPYLVGVPSARAALDAVRAARQLDTPELGDRTVVWGHSQGGGAALWTGIEAQRYARDVPLAGVAALAPASDLVSLAGGLSSNPGGGLFGTFVVDGYSGWYPDVDFDDYIRPSARVSAEAITQRCLSEPAILLSILAVAPGESVFSRNLASGPLRDRLAANVPDRPTPTPTFIGQGLTDQLVLPPVQRRFAERLCDRGQQIEYRAYPDRDHIEVVADGSPLVGDLLSWTEARFAGRPQAAGCSFSEG